MVPGTDTHQRLGAACSAVLRRRNEARTFAAYLPGRLAASLVQLMRGFVAGGSFLKKIRVLALDGTAKLARSTDAECLQRGRWTRYITCMKKAGGVDKILDGRGTPRLEMTAGFRPREDNSTDPRIAKGAGDDSNFLARQYGHP